MAMQRNLRACRHPHVLVDAELQGLAAGAINIIFSDHHIAARPCSR
jgi:hypothetical protein